MQFSSLCICIVDMLSTNVRLPVVKERKYEEQLSPADSDPPDPTSLDHLIQRLLAVLTDHKGILSEYHTYVN